MDLDRRRLFVGAAAFGLAAPVMARAQAQPTSPAPPRRSAADRIADAAREARLPIRYRDGRFSGAGWDRLLAAGRESLFFLLGEQHGIAENGRLAGALFGALVPEGYRHAAIETSPPMARALDRALLDGGVAGLRRLFADPGSTVAFFGMREEAEWLATAREALPGRAPFLWGLDYEVGADRHLIDRLGRFDKPAPAAVALAALQRASRESWARYAETRSPQHIFSFAGDPAMVRAVRGAWPHPPEEAAIILATLEETFEINRAWVAGRGWDSNRRRSGFMRANFLREWRRVRRRDPSKVFLKFGASHLVRGVNFSHVYDLGSLLPEIAASEGGRAFHLLVLNGPGSQTAHFDPSAFTYRPGPEDQFHAELAPLIGARFDTGFTLLDMEPLRPLARFGAEALHPDLVRIVHGFDAVLVMTGSTPSANLL